MDDISQVDPSETEDYSFEQLKAAVLRRQESMQRIKDIYANDPRAKRTGIDAGLMEFSGQNFGGNSRVNFKPFIDGRKAQEEFLFQNKLQPELLQQKNDETDPFTDMIKKVMNAKAKSYKPEVKVVGGSLVKYDSTTDTTEVLFSDIKNSPIYARIWDQIYQGSLNDKLQFGSDAERRAYVTAETEKAFASAVAKDSTKLGSQTPGVGGPMELPRTPQTNATQTGRPTEIGTTPAMKRPMSNESPDKALADISNRFINVQRDLKLGKIDKANADMRIAALNEERKRIISIDKLAPIDQEQPIGVAKVPNGTQPELKTIREREADKTRGGEEYKGYESAKQSIAALRSANLSLAPMEGILLSGKNTSGQLHETLNKIGGYMNYIDPTNSLAQSSGNDAVYFANLMNLVRDKIKALGAGTAVSNLDLIVSQKSLGDLRNTPEGNLKLIGIMKLLNATEASWAEGKVSYYDNNKDTFKGHKTPDGSLYAVRARRNPYKDGSIMSYDIQSKGDWVKEQIRRNPGKDIPQDVLDREWERFAGDSVKAMFK